MAVRRWEGKAHDIAQEDEIVVAGTWATSETVTLTINNRDIVVTIGTLITTTQVATTIKETINGDTYTDTGATVTPQDSTGKSIAQNFGEFAEVSATVSSSTVTVHGNTAGKPFTMTSSETSTSGTLTHNTGGAGNSVSATGKCFFDNADNWSGETVPIDADDVWFDSGNVNCCYGLAQSAVTPATLSVTAGYTGKIGLADMNIDNTAKVYREYRNTYLALGNSGDATNMVVDIGKGAGSGSGQVRLDFGTGQFTGNVYRTGARAVAGVPSLLMKGTHASNELNVHRGDVGFTYYEDETGHLATLRTLFMANISSDATVYVGNGVNLDDSTVEALGGTIWLDSSGVTGTLNVFGGTVHIQAGSWQNVTVGGINSTPGIVYYYANSTITTLKIRNDGTANFNLSPLAKTVTNCTMLKGSTYIDELQKVTLSNNIILDECSLDEVTIKTGKDITINPRV